MILVALDNLLNEQIMVDRFHADRRVETGEFLLNERAPATAPREWPAGRARRGERRRAGRCSPTAPAPWSPDAQRRPQAFVLEQRPAHERADRLRAAGGSRWKGLAVTRYQPDARRAATACGSTCATRTAGESGSRRPSEGRTTFAVHKAEFHQRDEGISVHVDVAVAPADDVEVRQVTLHNETGSHAAPDA